MEADYKYCGVYHEHVTQKESGEFLEDKIFHVIHCTNARGDMKQTFEGGRNVWMTRDEAINQEKIFDSFDLEIDMVATGKQLVERHVSYSKDLF